MNRASPPLGPAAPGAPDPVLPPAERLPEPSLLSLRFADPALETAYLAEHNQVALTPLRVLLVLGAAITASGTLVDLVAFGAGAMAVTTIRMLAAIGMLAGFGLTFLAPVRAHLQAFVALGAVAVHLVWFMAAPWLVTAIYTYAGAMTLNIALTFVGAGILFRWSRLIAPVALCLYTVVIATSGAETLGPAYYLLAVTLVLGFAGYTSERARRMAWIDELALTDEKARSETLLHNILPVSIAARMRDGATVIADRYDRACVLFADIVNFTPLAATRPPEETIGILDDIFTRFDRIADELNLEKIKTIGDAYMLVAGLPPERTSDIGRIGDAALRMRQTIAEVAETRGLDLKIRAGLHFGPVVAGVIGRRKFLYDLWGDTVNVASRMESTASPGEIQASEAVYHRLHDEFAFEERGEVEIKGKGRMRIYRLLGQRDAAIEHADATPSLAVADPVAAAARPV